MKTNEIVEPTIDYPAVWIVHTPSGPTDACDKHANKLQRLMKYMGIHTNKTPAREGAQCLNCIHELKQGNVYETTRTISSTVNIQNAEHYNAHV